MKRVASIEIIGGGLAGLSLGLALQRAGVSTTIAEAGTYPRHRVCGEFITGLDARTISQLQLAPLLDDAVRNHDLAWFADGRLVRVESLPAPALGLSRHTLDRRLADAYVAADGVLRCNMRVTDTSPRPGRVFATGRRSGRPCWIGLKLHAAGCALARDLELHLGRECYVGLSRIENGRVNICGLFRCRKPSGGSIDAAVPAGQAAASAAGPASVGLPATAGRNNAARLPPALFLAHLELGGLTALAARLRSIHLVPGTFCATTMRDFDPPVLFPHGIRIGDAGAMIPPFTGNGMAMAFQSAAVALEPLRRFALGAASWPETCHATHTALRSRFRMRLVSAGILHPFLLRPRRQRWLAVICRARLLPFRPLYAILH